MATLKLVRVQLVGNWQPNTQADVRFGNIPIGSTLTVPTTNTWVNYPPSATLNFTGSDNLYEYLNGAIIGQCSNVISPLSPKTNAQVVIGSMYGVTYVTYNVIV